MKVRLTLTDELYSGETAVDIVQQMLDRTWFEEPGTTLEKFMDGMAKRSLAWNGAVIDTISPEHFLRSLEAGGFAEIN